MKERVLRKQKLNTLSLRMVAHSDSRFGNCDDMGTKLGFIVLLMDETGRTNWLAYTTYKCRHAVRSVLAGETYAFADRFYAAYAIKYDLLVVMNHNILLTMLTDPKSLFQIIMKSTVAIEKRLMIDIKATREAYSHDKIMNIGWIRSKRNTADRPTKREKSDCLEELLEAGKVTIDAE